MLALRLIGRSSPSQLQFGRTLRTFGSFSHNLQSPLHGGVNYSLTNSHLTLLSKQLDSDTKRWFARKKKVDPSTSAVDPSANTAQETKSTPNSSSTSETITKSAESTQSSSNTDTSSTDSKDAPKVETKKKKATKKKDGESVTKKEASLGAGEKSDTSETSEDAKTDKIDESDSEDMSDDSGSGSDSEVEDGAAPSDAAKPAEKSAETTAKKTRRKKGSALDAESEAKDGKDKPKRKRKPRKILPDLNTAEYIDPKTVELRDTTPDAPSAPAPFKPVDPGVTPINLTNFEEKVIDSEAPTVLYFYKL